MVLKELIFNYSILQWCAGLERTEFCEYFSVIGCGCLERTHYVKFPLWEFVVVLEGLI